MKKVYDWNENIKRNQKFPNTFRCLIIGESNSGKTCLLLKFLLEPLWIDYNNVLLIGNSLYQLKYRIISEAFLCGYTKEEIRQLFELKNYILKSQVGKLLCDNDEDGLIEFVKSWKLKQKTCNKLRETVQIETFKSDDDIPDPSDIDKSLKTVVIFDDTMNNRNQDVQKSYFTRGRHSNCSVFYLAQSYFALDRKSIRMNSNILILFRLGELDVYNIWRDRIQVDMKLDAFRDFCKRGWEDDYGFVFINFDKSYKSGKRYLTHHDIFENVTNS
jgi:hypothetical protein